MGISDWSSDVCSSDLTKGSLGTAVGAVTLGLELGWVPKQDNFGGDNIYLAGKAELPLAGTNASLFGRFGYENGDVYDNKLDWEAGASYSFGSLVASLSYVDTNYQGAAQGGRLDRAGRSEERGVGKECDST